MSVDVPRRRRALLAAAVLPAVVLVACGGGSGGDGGDDGAATEAALAATDAEVAVVGTDTLRWEPDRLSAEAGEISLALVCEGGVNHNLVIEEVGQVAECARGGTDEASIELDEGTYEYVCTVPGHDRTMRGELTVR